MIDNALLEDIGVSSTEDELNITEVETDDSDIRELINSFKLNINNKNKSVIETNSKDDKFTIDLEQGNPKKTAELINDAHNKINIRAKIYNYITNNDIQNISFDDFINNNCNINKDTKLDIGSFDKYFNILLNNRSVTEEDDNLFKIYKLKSRDSLIDDIIELRNGENTPDGLKDKIYTFLDKVEIFYNQNINNKNNEVESLNNEVLELNNKINDEVLEQNDSEDLKNSIIDFFIQIDENYGVDGLEDLSIQELLGKLDNLIKIKLNNSGSNDEIDNEIDNEQINELNNDIEELKETIKQKDDFIDSFDEEKNKLNNEIKELKKQSVDSVKVKELNTQILNKDEQINKLNNEIKELKKKPNRIDDKDSNSNNKKEDKEELLLNNIGEPDKKKKKIILISSIVGGILFLIIAFFSVGLYLVKSDEDGEKNKNVSYAKVESKPNSEIDVPKEENLNDFDKDISVEELKNYKYDIFKNNWKKVRINGVDFKANSIINGYKFVKTRSNGKIMFIKDNKAIWVKMK